MKNYVTGHYQGDPQKADKWRGPTRPAAPKKFDVPKKGTPGDENWEQRQGWIDDRWDSTKKAQTTQLEGQYNTTKAELENQLNQTGQYNAMRNQASVNHAMQERARKEQMANMGMSGAGSTSRTFQQRNTNNLNNQIGSINRQEQDYKNNVNLALGNLKTQYDSNVASIMAQNDAQRNAEYLSDNQWMHGHNMQKDQFERTYGLQRDQFEEGQRQFNSNFGLQEKQFGENQRQFDQNYLLAKDRAKLEQANALRDKGRISRWQYRDKVNSLYNY